MTPKTTDEIAHEFAKLVSVTHGAGNIHYHNQKTDMYTLRFQQQDVTLTSPTLRGMFEEGIKWVRKHSVNRRIVIE